MTRQRRRETVADGRPLVFFVLAIALSVQGVVGLSATLAFRYKVTGPAGALAYSFVRILSPSLPS